MSVTILLIYEPLTPKGEQEVLALIITKRNKRYY